MDFNFPTFEAIISASTNAESKKRMDYSTDSRMSDAVVVWDEIDTQWKVRRLNRTVWNHIFTNGAPSKIKFAKSRGINPHTFQKYACSNKSKRRKIGTKIGRPALKTQQQIEEEEILRQDRDLVGEYYKSLYHFTTPLDLLQLKELRERREQKERDTRLREKIAYQRLLLNFCRAPSTMKQKRFEEAYWDRELPRVCKMIRADDSFLGKEQKLLKSCHRTFGSAAVKYVGPGLDEWSKEGAVETYKRRKWIKTQIKEFQRVQTSHALAVTGGVGSPTLLVALDHLLTRYDQKRMTHGLEPSDFRNQLREDNYFATREVWMKEGGEFRTWGEWKKRQQKMRPIDISQEKQLELRRQMLSKIARERTYLDEVGYENVRVSKRLTW